MAEQERGVYTAAVESLRDRLAKITERLSGLKREETRLSAESLRLKHTISYLDALASEETATLDLEGLAPAPAANAGGPFAGKTIEEATVTWLEETGPPFRDTNEVIAATTARGLETKAKSPYTSYYGTLNRAAGREGNRLVKRDGKWGLREWLSDESTDEDASEEESLEA